MRTEIQDKKNQARIGSDDRTRPVFVVGVGRSGTTLARTMLGAHPRIAVPPETHYLHFAAERGATERKAPEDFEAFWSELTCWRRFQDLDVAPEAVRTLLPESGGETFRGVFVAMLSAYARKEGKARLGEKTPGHFRRLDLIFDWFPDARVIVLRRDPRAVVASHLGSPWITNYLDARGLRAPLVPRFRLYHVAERAAHWARIHAKNAARIEADPRILVVAYEELVSDTENVARRMTDFVGEDYALEMITGRDRVPGSAARDTIQSDRWRNWLTEHEARSGAPITADGTEKWRRILSPSEVAMVEGVCAAEMAGFGYHPSRPPYLARRAGRLARALVGAKGTEARIRRRLSGLGAGAGFSAAST